MNKKTVALTEEQFHNLIDTIKTGAYNFRPNEQVATCLVLEANLGLRIGDILRLKLCNFIKDGDRYRLNNVIEEKTSKKRPWTVPEQVYHYVVDYCMEHDIKKDEYIFKIKERQVQSHLKKVADYLGYEGIGTHSFRKFFGTRIYKDNGYDIVLVQQIFQHSSPRITQHYIGITSKRMEDALTNNVILK